MSAREFPHNAEAETWLLGGLLQDPKEMARFAGTLAPSDFYLERNSLVWEAMQKLNSEGAEINVLSVGNLLKAHWQFGSLFGDNDYLFSLMESVPSSASAEYFAELIAKTSALRKLIFATQKTLNEAFAPGADADEVLAEAIERVSEIASRSANAKCEHLADAALRFLDDIKERMARGMPMGRQTGFRELDRITGGLRPGELIIAGARTGMGKTSFAMSVALNAAKEMPVKFFSIEVSANQLIPRALSFFSQVNMQRTLNANIGPDEFDLQCEAAAELRKINIHGEFETSAVEKIIAESHAFAAKHGPGLIVIDHLHFIKTGEKNYENKNIELGKVTRALKELAKKLQSPVLLLSQLNRDIDRAAGKNKIPRLSDLRDSGNIEQDADMVWFLHRPGYYDPNLDLSETWLIIAKNRSGPTGEARLHFDLNTTKFSDAAPSLYY